MTLRDSLKTAVARCTSQQMQPATSERSDATGDATKAQLRAANPHGIRDVGATRDATTMRRGAFDRATQALQGQKLQVAFASTCNTQPGPLTAHRVTAALLEAAMRACDRYGDGETARMQMRADCLALPIRLQQDLLDHFNGLCAPLVRGEQA